MNVQLDLIGFFLKWICSWV